MPSILFVGVIIFMGFICGELATRMKLPKVTGYILAGVLLNPNIFDFIPKDVTRYTGLITSIALSFITFSIGGTLLWPRIKRLGKSLTYITLFEAEFTFLAVAAGFLLISPFFFRMNGATWVAVFIPLSLLVAALASPTDPTATLAVVHEYKAKGEVASTILGVAAFDDVLGIINYSLAVVFAEALILHQKLGIASSFLRPFIVIIGAVLLGVAFGFIFNRITLLIKKETEGVFIVLIFALLMLCFGAATVLGVDELLATMTMGIMVVNFNLKRETIFKMLERYTEELVFVLFFTLSGMQLNFSILWTYSLAVLFFVFFRSLGKILGTGLGATLAGSSSHVKKYTAGGLIPQGGIVIGLALLVQQNQVFAPFSAIVFNIIIGATVIHELAGPLLSKLMLQKAGEIR